MSREIIRNKLIGRSGGEDPATTAPADAQYLTLAANAELTVERVLTPSTGLTAVDSGAGAAYTITVDLSTGKAGGLTVTGGTAASEDLTLRSTTHATKGQVFFGNTSNFYDETTGAIVLGHTAQLATLGEKFEINTTANFGGQYLNTWSATAAQGALIHFNRSKSATIGTHSIVASGDSLGGLIFQGSDGTNFDDAASIEAQVGSTPGAGTDMPGRLLFKTTNDGSATLTERMRIWETGVITVGTGVATAVTNAQMSLSGGVITAVPNATTKTGLLIHDGGSGAVGNLHVIAYHFGQSTIPCVFAGAKVVNGAGSTKSDFIVATRDVTTETAATIQFRINSSGNLILDDALTVAGTNATQTLVIGTGTAPAGNIVDGVQIYSADQAVGNACMHTRTENGGIIKLFTGAALTGADVAALSTGGAAVLSATDQGVIDNMRTRINELQSRLQAAGLIT